MPNTFFHKNIRLPGTEYIGAKSYFVTFSVAGRRKIFTTPEIGLPLLMLLRQESEARGFGIAAYCLMPDHLHFLAMGRDLGSNLLSFIKAFRIKSSRSHARSAGAALWQKKFYDHILRSNDSIESVAWYIWMNPVRAGFVTQVQDFPFAGSFVDPDPFRRRKPIDFWVPPWK